MNIILRLRPEVKPRPPPTAFGGGAGTETGRRVLEAVAGEPADGEAVRAFASRVRERAGAALPGLEEER